MTSTIKVNNVQNQCGQNIINENSNTITIGASGDTIALASGASQTGFGKTGSVDYITTPKTTDFTAVAGEGYFVNTAGGAVTVTLPGSPSAGDMIVVSDYNSTAGTNNITINRNSNKINGTTENLVITKANSAVQLVFVDATTGYQSVATANTSDVSATRLEATGGTVSESGDFKIHTFTGPGTFAVSQLSETASENTVDYLVVGGGGGGGGYGGGGGAGGFRFFANPNNPQSGPGAPRNAPAGIEVLVQPYPITVGAGGTGNPPTNSPYQQGNPGGVSTFSTITSAGGGGGGRYISPTGAAGNSGGSGGGGGMSEHSGTPSGGSGNTPSVSPPQGEPGGGSGNRGGSGPYPGSGGGGGAMASGSTYSGQTAGPGGAGGGVTGFGSSNGQCSSCVQYFSGGGGGRGEPPGNGGAGGLGGGGAGAHHPTSPGDSGTAGTINTGGGSGASAQTGSTSGGSGIVVIRYRFK